MADKQSQYGKEYRIYKPRQSNDGAASRLQIRVNAEPYREVFLFWETTTQTGTDANGNASFGWKEKEKTITFKLGEVDVAELLLVLKGKKEYAGPPPKEAGKPGMGLYHKNPNGNTILQLQRDQKGAGFYLSISRQSAANKSDVVRIKHTISNGEAEILQVLLTDAVSCIFGWHQLS